MSQHKFKHPNKITYNRYVEVTAALTSAKIKELQRLWAFPAANKNYMQIFIGNGPVWIHELETPQITADTLTATTSMSAPTVSATNITATTVTATNFIGSVQIPDPLTINQLNTQAIVIKKAGETQPRWQINNNGVIAFTDGAGTQTGWITPLNYSGVMGSISIDQTTQGDGIGRIRCCLIGSTSAALGFTVNSAGDIFLAPASGAVGINGSNTIYAMTQDLVLKPHDAFTVKLGGFSTLSCPAPMTFYSYTTQSSSIGSGTTNYVSQTFSGNTMKNNNDMMEITWLGGVTNNSNSKNVGFNLNGYGITIPLAANTTTVADWKINLCIWRASATTIHYNMLLNHGPYVDTRYGKNITITTSFATNTAITLTMQGVANGDVNGACTSMRYYPGS